MDCDPTVQFVAFLIGPCYWWHTLSNEYSGCGVNTIDPRHWMSSQLLLSPSGLCTVQEDRQETGVIETQMGSDGNVGVPHVVMYVVDDWGSTFDFQNAVTSILRQRVSQSWEMIRLLLHFDLVTQGCRVHHWLNLGLWPADSEAKWSCFFLTMGSMDNLRNNGGYINKESHSLSVLTQAVNWTDLWSHRSTNRQ